MGLLWFLGDQSVSNWETVNHKGPQAVAIFLQENKEENHTSVATFYGVMSEGTSRAHDLSMIIIFPKMSVEKTMVFDGFINGLSKKTWFYQLTFSHVWWIWRFLKWGYP